MTQPALLDRDPLLANAHGSLPACLLEREIGRPAGEWTVDDLVDLVHAREIRVVSLMHVGGDGWIKTLDFVPRDVNHLRDILEGGERADGSSLFRGMGIEHGASDIALRPRLETAFLDPFAPQPTLALLCSHYGPDGQPLPVSPDTVIHRAFERLKREADIELLALGEVEYFLGKRKDEADGWGETDRGYHASAPFVFGEGLRRQALTLLAEIGVPIKYGHSEVGYIPSDESDPLTWEQHEIELALAPLPKAADGVVLTQWVLRNLAVRAGMRCCFDPVVRKGHAGSGLHFHLSPQVGGEARGGRDPEGRLFDESRWLIGGLARLGGTLMAFGNREHSSFVRLLQGKEAPSRVTWGELNRQALIRLPTVPRTKDGRAVASPTVEFRLPDGSVHPHLLLAGLAQALLYGRSLEDLDALLERTRARKGESHDGGERLPFSFQEIAGRLRRDRAHFEAGGVFPEVMLDGVIASLDAMD